MLLARAQLVGRLLLEWRTKQVLEYENRAKRFKNEEIFQDNQMVYLLAPHASALQTNTTKFKQDFIGPLVIDTALDKTHYRLKDVTGLLLDGTYHVNHIKKGSARSPLGIVDKFDTYETALKNTLLNKFAIETPNNKLQEVTLQDGSKELDYLPGTIMDYAPNARLKEVSKPNIEKQEQLLTDKITMTLIPYRLVHPLNVMSIEKTMMDK